MERLAQEISAAEGATKVLAWQTIQQWESGNTGPQRKRMQAVAQVLDLSLDQSLGVDATSAGAIKTQVKLNVEEAVTVTEKTSAFLPGFAGLSIPLLSNAASMGVGAEQLHDDIVVGRLTVSPDWVSRSLKPTRVENLRFIHGYGDSMDPTFLDGDVLLVDVGVRDPKIDGVYVLEANQRIYIKRVRQRMDGSFEISSDNPTVKTVDVLNGENPVQVHGRVVWCWNGRKM